MVVAVTVVVVVVAAAVEAVRDVPPAWRLMGAHAPTLTAGHRFMCVPAGCFCGLTCVVC